MTTAVSLSRKARVRFSLPCATGDRERQIAFRFGVPEIADLESANRPLNGTDRVWYDFADLPSGELAPVPDHQPELDG
ncbi:hypothetical protein FBY36_3579 [Arthrobacter sp. SLBN-122]|nr:hypothetical protein FBY36_3579 [Arthrobacter sp. SLBN-122]